MSRDCRFDIDNPQLMRLLRMHIFEQPPAPLTPEELSSDMACNVFRTLMMTSWQYEGWRPDLSPEGGLICPEYCVMIEQWRDDHPNASANCL